MKISNILSLAIIFGCISTVYGNIVGYVNVPIYAGTNYIANQLPNGDSSLNTIFGPGIVPEGATFTEWNPATLAFLPVSTYDTVAGWSINYTLTYGQGGQFVSPSTFNNTFEGSLWPGYNPDTTFVPPLITGNGVKMLSCYVPITGVTFYQVVGRDPLNGESVTELNAATQTYTTTTFNSGSWNNGAPTFAIGESALFNLGPVPEPGVYGLIGLGMLVFGTMRRGKLPLIVS